MKFTFDNPPENTLLCRCEPGQFETMLTIPDIVAFIHHAALKGCTAITDVVLPYSLHENQDGKPFSVMTALERFSVNDPPAQLMQPVFSANDGVLYRHHRLVRWPTGCSEADFSIPEDVRVIGRHAFSGALHLKTVVLHDKVFDVQESAFAGCRKLTSVTLRSPEFIRDKAFLDCFNLTSISLSRSPAEIGHAAFSRCTRLQRITLPDGLESLGSEAFAYCIYLQQADLPNGLQRIGDGAFICCFSLQEITLPPSLKYVGLNVFYDCRNLKKISCTREVAALIPEYKDLISIIPSPDNP